MNGVSRPVASAGSNHDGASATATAHVSWPSAGAAAAALAGRLLVPGPAPVMVVPRQEERKRAAAVAERNSEVRALLGGPAVDHRCDRQARIGGIADRIERRLRGEAIHHRRAKSVHE